MPRLSANLGFHMILTCLACASIIGCGRQPDHANFMKVKDGMTEQEVMSILGKPTREEERKPHPGMIVSPDGFLKHGPGKIMVWTTETGRVYNSYSVLFMDGKVVETRQGRPGLR